MSEESGLYKAGTILLLVGAILNAVGALLMLILTVGSDALFADLNDGEAPTALAASVYVVLAAILVAGAVFGFVAYGKAQRGDAGGAFVFGLVAALLPPLQVVPLLGAIFCKVSPEGSGQAG